MNVALRGNRAVRCCTRSLVLCLAVWALAGAGEARAAGDAPPDPKLDPALRQALAQGTEATTIRVIVHTTTGSIAPVRAHIQSSGNSVAAEHAFISALSARLPAKEIRDLEALPFVDHISLDAVVLSSAGPPPPKPGPVDEPLLSTLGLLNRTGMGIWAPVSVSPCSIPACNRPPAR